jgi:hypothetical protein
LKASEKAERLDAEDTKRSTQGAHRVEKEKEDNRKTQSAPRVEEDGDDFAGE